MTTAPPQASSAAAARDWGDVSEEDEDFFPPPEVTGPDEKGIKTITEYRRDEAGHKVKVTRKVRVTTRTRRVPKAVTERAKWMPFGRQAPESGRAEEAQTILSRDDIKIENPLDEDAEARQHEETMKRVISKFAETQMKRKLDEEAGIGGGGLRRGGLHDPELEARSREEGGGGNAALAALAAGGGGGGLGGGGGGEGGRYLPPSMRGGEGGPGAGRFMDRDDSNTLRVTNISENADERDLKELFGAFGPTTRVYLAKDRETGASRGFAYVSFVHHQDAENAMKKLHGYGYDHLILNVSFAQQDRDRASGPPRDNSMKYATGYGKALPQG